MLHFSLLLSSLWWIHSVGALAASGCTTTTTTTSSSTITGGSNMQSDDAILHAFHERAAAAVELSNAHVFTTTTSPDWSFLSVERSLRDWDHDCRRKILYHVPLWHNPDQQTNDNSNEPTPSSSKAPQPPILPPIPPTPLDPTLMARCVSPSGKRSVLIYSNNNNKDKKQQRLELYEGGSLIHRIESAALKDLHGSILVGDVTFGSPSFGHSGGVNDEGDDDYFVYTAERNPPQSTSYWNPPRDTTTTTTTNHNSKSSLRGTQHVLGKGVSEQWGERYEALEVALTDVYLLHIPTGKLLGRIPILDDVHYHPQDSTLGSICICQPILHPTNPNQLTVTVFDAGGLGHMSRRLGMVYCRNRPSQIVTVDFSQWNGNMEPSKEEMTTSTRTGRTTTNTTTTSITPSFKLARSPRYIQLLDGSVSIVFLGHRVGFHSHDGCMGLYAFEEHTNAIREIIPIIESPGTEKDHRRHQQHSQTVLGMAFPGIFTGDLPSQCHIPGTNCILFNTIWGSVSRLLSVDIVSGQRKVIQVNNGDPQSDLCSYSLLCLGKDMMIVTKTSSNLPEQLWKVPFTVVNGEMTTGVATPLVEFGSMACTSFSSIERPTTHAPGPLPFDVDILSVKLEDTTEPIQAVVLLPRHVDGKVPLVVVPHGGPHGCSTSTYVSGFALLASRYAVVLPNYRGSTGFGQAPLTSLLGNIGRMDVDDVMACTRAVLDRYAPSRIDIQRIALCGGSHGGFLTAHCTSQFPHFFKAAVMRNPVTNIASMVTSTDIPDWCHAECMGTTLDFGAIYRGPTQEELNSMYEKSPISRVDKVQTPTLIALGLKDLRVPPMQGKEWYFTLRSRGIPTELLIYPEDNHSLSGTATEADHWIRIMEWFDQHL